MLLSIILAFAAVPASTADMDGKRAETSVATMKSSWSVPSNLLFISSNLLNMSSLLITEAFLPSVPLCLCTFSRIKDIN